MSRALITITIFCSTPIKKNKNSRYWRSLLAAVAQSSWTFRKVQFDGTPEVFRNQFDGTPEVFRDQFDGTPKVLKVKFDGTPEVFKDQFDGTQEVFKYQFDGTPEEFKDLFDGSPTSHIVLLFLFPLGGTALCSVSPSFPVSLSKYFSSRTAHWYSSVSSMLY